MSKFIFVADLHLREDRPRCRLDSDWMEVQKKLLGNLALEANQRNCPVIMGGDIFNRPIVSEAVVNMFLEFTTLLKYPVMFIAGNHDLPGHSMKNVGNSSIGVLFSVANINSPKITTIDKYFPDMSFQHFGEEIVNPGKEVLVLHRLVFRNPKSVPPNVDAVTASELLDEFPDYKYILTGDCHIPFCYERDGRYVINPGHFSYQKSNETDIPIYYYIDTEIEGIEDIDTGDKDTMVTDAYIRAEEEKEDRIESFVEKLKDQEELSLSFEDNIEQALLENKDTLSESTIKMIRFLMEGTK